MEDLFKDPEYCRSELVEVRKVMNNAKATPEMLNKIGYTLGMMYSHCPDNMHIAIEVAMDTVERRIQNYVNSDIEKERRQSCPLHVGSIG